MSIEGEIRVSLLWDGRRVQGPTVRSTRPFAAARLAAGRRPTEAATLVPTLFLICGHAQAAAAAAALRAAGARPDGMPAIRMCSVPLEAVQDTLASRELAPVRASHPSRAASAASTEAAPMLSEREFLLGATPRGDRGT